MMLRSALAILLVASPAGAQLTVRVEVPAVTPADAAVHIAGTFNGWNPGAAEYRLERQGDGTYSITLPATVRGPIEFKFTLGSWEAVETDVAGASIGNRRFTVPAQGPSEWRGAVSGWRDPATPVPPRASTRTASVTIAADSFAMAPLDRTRRVWVYVPPHYGTSGRRYPVLYMHDGQNVFDDATSYAGEWGVDETLDSLYAAGDSGVIVVAVDHGGPRRLDEYSPWRNPQLGGGEGEAYVDFLVNTLKPWIDARYRTRPDPANTGVAGSSMGGLISLYAALERPDVFGRAAVFSPAFWFSDSTHVHARETAARAAAARIYMVTGGREGERPEEYVRGHQQMAEILAAAGFGPQSLTAIVRPDGTHAESFWRREFAAGYLWLFGR